VEIAEMLVERGWVKARSRRAAATFAAAIGVGEST
jgi:hypothetical protein